MQRKHPSAINKFDNKNIESGILPDRFTESTWSSAKWTTTTTRWQHAKHMTLSIYNFSAKRNPQIRSALFLGFAHREMVVPYLRFGLAYRSHLQGSCSPRRLIHPFYMLVGITLS